MSKARAAFLVWITLTACAHLAQAAPTGGGSMLHWSACDDPRAALRGLAAGADARAADTQGAEGILSRIVDCGTGPDGVLDEAHAALFRELLAHGADAAHADAHGDTAVLTAARKGNSAVIEPLVRAGASPTAANANGETPMAIALGASVGGNDPHPEVARALLSVSRWLRVERMLATLARAQAWLTLPVWIALVFVLLQWRARPAAVARRAIVSGDGLPRLVALTCASCGAPVPVDTRDLACPHCRAPIEIPEDYEATIATRARAAVAVREAVRRWKRVLAIGSRWITTPLEVLGVAWIPLVMLGHFSPFNAITGPNGVTERGGAAGYCFVLATSLVWAASLVGYGMWLSSARARVPSMTDAGHVGDPADEACRVCGAPLHYGAGELVACCAYCGGECYRVAVARAARAEAENAESHAQVSIYDAMCELDARARGAAQALVIAGSVVIALALAIGVLVYTA